MNSSTLKAIAVAVGAALLVAVGWFGNGWRMGEQLAELRAVHATEQRNQALVQVNAVDRARLEEQRRTAAERDSANETVKQLEGLRKSAAASDSARRELFARVTALTNAARRPGDSGAVSAGPAAGDPVVLLADVFGRADQRAGELAQYADAARIAGEKCQRDYDSLTTGSDANISGRAP